VKQETGNRKQPRFYFSLRSPYSWLAFRDLRDRYAGVAAGLRWIPFWEPDDASLALLTAAGGEFTYTQMSRSKHFYVLRDVRRLAAERDLTYSWPVDRDPRWDVPHLAYLTAARLGLGPQFLDHAYRVRWQEGGDICDPATMAAIGEDMGIDGAMLALAVDDPTVRDEGTRALLSAYRDGVFGVPFFVVGADKFWGVDRLAAFVDAIPESREDAPVPTREPAFAALAKTADDGHAGGCG
jgi:2-hydroxychromene-2-carboxylate isomerase